MLFQRYANPMIILDKMIRAGRFTEFVQEVLRIRNQEMVDQARWEYWLHRVFEMSFQDYLATVDGTEEVLSDDVMEATVKDSMGIINGFCPS
jgi:hypothetical protein